VRATRPDDAGIELLFEQGQDALAHPHAGEAIVVVVGVVPRLEVLIVAGLLQRGPAHLEQRPAVEASDGGHARDAEGAAAAREPEQHGLGLVVERMAEQHGGGTELDGGDLERCVSGRARRGLGATRATRARDGFVASHRRGAAVQVDANAFDAHGLEPEFARRLRCRLRDSGRLGLQAVVDDDGSRAHAQAGCLERGCRGEGHRVGPAAQRDEHELAGFRRARATRGELAEALAHRAAHVGNRGGEPRATLRCRGQCGGHPLRLGPRPRARTC